MLFSQVLYLTMVYACSMTEVNELMAKLKQCSETLSSPVLGEYLQCVDEENSM
jgi:hypothetical protein